MNNDYSNVNICQPEIWKKTLEDIQDKKFSMYTNNNIDVECKTFNTEILQVNQDTKLIQIVGLLVPEIPEYFKTYGITGTSYNQITKEIESANENPMIKNIILYCNSGGGFVNGVSNCANAIYNAALNPEKNVIGYVDGMCASGAFWLLSQCNYILSSETSEIGGIGVYSTIIDDTEIFESRNGKIYCLRSGKDKGIGEDKITDDQLSVLQENINDLAEIFINNVSKGRSLKKDYVAEISTGRVWVAGKSKSLKLIDEITNQSINTLIKDYNTMSEIIKKIDNNNNEEVKVETITQDEILIDNTSNENVEIQEEIKVENETEINKSEIDESIERERIMNINDMFSEIDINFAKEMISENKTFNEAKEIYLQKSISLKKSLLTETIGVEAIPVNEAKNENENDISYYEFAKKLCSERNIKMIDAGKIIEKEFPEMRNKLFNR